MYACVHVDVRTQQSALFHQGVRHRQLTPPGRELQRTEPGQRVAEPVLLSVLVLHRARPEQALGERPVRHDVPAAGVVQLVPGPPHRRTWR